MVVNLSERITQAQFAELIGVSEARVSQMKADGLLRAGDTGAQWLLMYVERLREQAAGRLSESGKVDVVHARALLAMAQCEGQEIKNAVARGEYAPISMLGDVLANASQAVVDRLEQISSQLRVNCPDLPPAALATVMEVVTSARNEMARKTTSLMADLLEADDGPVEEDPATLLTDDDTQEDDANTLPNQAQDL
jgi:phage terminase Nu1 subunit (DNA packaging protein)